MGKKKLIYLLFLGIITFLLASSFISAELFQYKANVRISAGADQNLVVRFEDTSTKKILQSIRETTDSAGYATIEFETNSEEINVIIVFVKNLSQYLEDSNVIRTEVAGPYSTDGRIVIDVGQLIAEKNKKESENITTNETIENTSTDEITPPPETEEITTEEDNQENKEGANVGGKIAV